jgi:hypothetical protein
LFSKNLINKDSLKKDNIIQKLMIIAIIITPVPMLSIILIIF